MTAQVGNRFRYKESEYTIVAKSEYLKFNPREYGIRPSACCSACWAGYWCEYEISEEGIFLKNLYIHTEDDVYPEINGRLPKKYPRNSSKYLQYMGHVCYDNLNLKMEYTGKIVVGKGFIDKYYIHMGYQPAWSYEELKEFVFENGVLKEVIDHSDVAEKLRQKIDEDAEFRRKMYYGRNIQDFVADSFDLDLAKKAWWIR